MNKKMLVVFALLACLAGCVPVDSLNPWFTEKDLAFDKSLLGVWLGPDNGGEGELEISSLADQNKQEFYELTLREGAKGDGRYTQTTVYRARLLQLSGKQFLDVVPQTVETRNDSFPLQVKSGKTGIAVEPRLLRLGAASYLEFGNGAGSANSGVEARLRAAHWILRVTKDGDKLQLDWADDDAFRKNVLSGKLKLSHMLFGPRDKQNVVITATTKELQAFVLEHADDATFFTDHVEPLHRKP